VVHRSDLFNHSLKIQAASIQLDFTSTNNPIRFSRLANQEGEGRDDYESGTTTVLEKPKLKKPPLYKVVLINDDYTPMDFVVEVLRSFFGMNVEKATQVMLKVHTEGKGVCGVFSKDVAESKATQVNDYSRECEQPLLCSVEVDR
jgi:ATP-dependent Clp protease adaptor protein ClpS